MNLLRTITVTWIFARTLGILANMLYIDVHLKPGEMYEIESNASYIGMWAHHSGEQILDFWKPVECWGTEIHAEKLNGLLQLTIPCWSDFEPRDYVTV